MSCRPLADGGDVGDGGFGQALFIATFLPTYLSINVIHSLCVLNTV